MLLDPPFCDTDCHRIYPVDREGRIMDHFECSDCGKKFYGLPE